jgi:hypothetical protein
VIDKESMRSTIPVISHLNSIRYTLCGRLNLSE